MSEMYKFVPKEDITVAELADMIAKMDLAIPWEMYSNLSVDISRHFVKKEEIKFNIIKNDPCDLIDDD